MRNRYGTETDTAAAVASTSGRRRPRATAIPAATATGSANHHRASSGRPHATSLHGRHSVRPDRARSWAPNANCPPKPPWISPARCSRAATPP
ncbi:hypothetical protein WKI68_24550 [Streptomyces sp. MS1.HAVA.3]|uniref:Uncharacterized protein n=1 Tax=Streptomyces caledonius TaxID=3134107 RepID=A0ABU8U736_9ACTN